MAVAREIASGSPLGVRAARRLIRQSADMDLSSATALSLALRDPLDDTQDSREGYAARVGKRPPEFSGRWSTIQSVWIDCLSTGSRGSCPHVVAPDHDPGPSPDSRGSLDGSALLAPAAAAS